MIRTLLKQAPMIVPATLILLASGVFTGCYTQLASNTYVPHRHRPQPVESDTFIVQEHPGQPQEQAQQQQAQQQAPSSPVYDTVMKGDTMFITERAPERTREDYTTNPSQPTNAAETIVNNYYGGYEPYDYWGSVGPRPALSITIGYPFCGYRSWYSPWYPYGYYPSWYYGSCYSGWCDPWDYPGFYPPLYDAYAPFYGGFYRPYYGGYGRYGYGYGYGYTGLTAGGRVPHYGRIYSGERRAGQSTSPATTPHSFIVVRNPSGGASNGMSNNALAANAANRNAPIHSVGPGSGGAVTNVAPAPANTGESRAPANTNQSTVATSNANAAGHHVVIVRRNAAGNPNGSSGYGSRGNYGTYRNNGVYRNYGVYRNGQGGTARGNYGGRARSGGSSGGNATPRSGGGGGGVSRSSGGGGGGRGR